MKKLISDILCFLIILMVPLLSVARDTDSTTISFRNRWDKRVHQKYTGWGRLRPTHFKMQYAGGMGLLTNGIGWDYGKRRQWETDILLGYLPSKYSPDGFRFTLTLKQNYIPWSMSFDKHWALEPLYCGLYFTTIAGEEFWKKEPGKYPNSYYNFSTKLRPYIFIGQRMNFQIDQGAIKHLAIFYEINTCEMYVISKATNHNISIRDILRFSFGIKIQIFKESSAPKNIIRNTD